MRYADASAFRQAIEQRIKTDVVGDDAMIVRRRKRIAFDRLLTRLVLVAPSKWVLKGGFALDLRISDQARATRDVDIAWHRHENELLYAGDLLLFAGIERVAVPVLPLELHVAEKLHAYTRDYGDGRSSSRVKDLVDLALISTHFTLSEDALAEAIRNTFAERASHEPPRSLPSPSKEWRAPYRSLAESIGLHPDIDTGFAQSAMLLNPVLAKLA